MKILLIHQFFIRHDEPGGSRHIELLRFFREHGHEVRVIAGSVNYMTNRSKLPFWRPLDTETDGGITTRWVYALPTLQFGLLGRLLNYLSFFILALPFVLAEKPDVILATSPPPTVGILGWLLSVFRKVPWILELRDLWPNVGADSGLIARGFLHSLLERISFSLYQKGSYVVTLTWGLEETLKKLGVSAKKITTIPNGVDEMFFSPPNHIFPELAENKFIVMYVGALGEANKLSTLIDLAEACRNDARIFFVIAGDGREKKKLETHVLKKSLNNVLFLGSVPREQIPSLLHYADVCLATWSKGPAFRHVISNKLFDYMASGVPVLLVAEEGDAWKILEKAKGGVRTDSEDIAAAQKWLSYFLENPSESKAMGKRGKDYVTLHFRRKNLALKYVEIFEKLR